MTSITGNLLHAARVLAGLDQNALAARAGVEVATVDALEARQTNGITVGDAGLSEVRTALEALGIEFTNDGAPGVRLAPKTVEGLRPDELTTANDV